MSNPLAIAAVTATLRNVLVAGFADDGAVSDTVFSTQPPDKARSGTTNQLNLFLFQTTANAAWRNQPMPHLKPGESGLPPLGLDLHYLLTAYGRGDDDVLGHHLLGRAMSIFHDHAVLGPDELHDALADNDLDAQPERVRLTPLSLSIDDMSRLWTTFPGAGYRISAAYLASVVLIESTRAATTPLPVLTRNPSAQGNLIPPFPTLDDVTADSGQASVRLGESITLRGHHLDGPSVAVRFSHTTWSDTVDLAPSSSGSDAVAVALPDAALAGTTWPAGFYGVAVTVGTNGDSRTTNELPLTLAPTLESVEPNPAARNLSGDVTLTIDFAPDLQPRQRASLLLGSMEVPLPLVDAATGSFGVLVRAAPAGDQFVRLRIDGVDSLLVDRSADPPTFDQTQRVTIT